MTPVPNFSQIGQKIYGCSNFDWNNNKNCLMTSYLSHSDDVSKISPDLRDFVPEYLYANFSGNWTSNKGETEGAMCPPAYCLPKYPSLNRVKVKMACSQDMIASPLGQKSICFILLRFNGHKVLLKYLLIFIFCSGRAFQ